VARLILCDVHGMSPSRRFDNFIDCSAMHDFHVVFSPDESLVALGTGAGVIFLLEVLHKTVLAVFNNLGKLAWPLVFHSSDMSDTHLISAAGIHDLSSYSISLATLSPIHAWTRHHYRVCHDGWVWDARNKRVCWVPTNFRSAHESSPSMWSASRDRKLAIITVKKSVVILDFSRVLEGPSANLTAS
jgi:hypothetical protein